MFATGVAIVTTQHEDEYHGLTVNSFTSVSLSPMLIQFNVARNTNAHRYLHDSGVFVVNILAEDQQLLSTIFSGAPPAERFRHAEIHESANACPVIEGSLAYIEARLVNIFDAGDHSIFLGEVVDMRIMRPDAAPLLYFKGQYSKLLQSTA